MRIIIERCTHCRATYHFQASGVGAGRNNHKEYCPTCWSAIKHALRGVPVRFKFEFIPQTEVTLEQLERWEKEWKEEHTGLLPLAHRVFASVYDTISQEHSRYGIVKGRGEYAKKVFNYQYWPSRRNEAVIGIGVETDIATGQQKPSEEFHNTIGGCNG